MMTKNYLSEPRHCSPKPRRGGEVRSQTNNLAEAVHGFLSIESSYVGSCAGSLKFRERGHLQLRIPNPKVRVVDGLVVRIRIDVGTQPTSLPRNTHHLCPICDSGKASHILLRFLWKKCKINKHYREYYMITNTNCLVNLSVPSQQ